MVVDALPGSLGQSLGISNSILTAEHTEVKYLKVVQLMCNGATTEWQMRHRKDRKLETSRSPMQPISTDFILFAFEEGSKHLPLR